MTDQAPQPSAPQPPPEGWIASLVASAKSLTLSNVVIIFLLILALAPAYVLYRVLNDEAMLYRFLSSYKEVPNPIPGSNCAIREVSVRGGGDTYGISTNFATLGTDRWQIGVTLNHKITPQDIETYCEVLNSDY